MMWTKIIGTNPFRSNRSEFLPVFLFRMTLSLLMHNSYIYIFFLIVLLLLLKPSFKLTTIRSFFFFFQVIENYIKRRVDIDGNLIRGTLIKKKFDGGTLLDENRSVRRLRRNRGSTCCRLRKLQALTLTTVVLHVVDLSLNEPHCLGTRHAPLLHLVTIFTFVLRPIASIVFVSKDRLLKSRDSFFDKSENFGKFINLCQKTTRKGFTVIITVIDQN